MSIVKKIILFKNFHRHVSDKRTGNPKQFCKKLDISRNILYDLIAESEALDMPITYSRKDQTFFYKDDVELILKFEVRKITDKNELREINGGCSTSFSSSNYSADRNLSMYSN